MIGIIASLGCSLVVGFSLWRGANTYRDTFAKIHGRLTLF